MLDKLFKDVIIHKDQGYALYYYNNGKVIEKTNGVVKEENSDLITFTSNFRLASVTKHFIAYGIVSLVKQGLISYDTKVKEIYEELPSYFNQIYIKNLLNHTSGIFDYEDMEHDDTQIKDQDILTFLKKTNTTYFKVGTKYKYSNTAYILLGLIIEKVSGKDISTFIEEEIFQKAKMWDSKVNIEGVTNIKNRAYGHIIEDGKLKVKDQYWCSATIGDGGLYSSINDLKKWAMYLSKSENFIDMKIPNYINEEEYNEYGLGIRIIKHNGKEVYYHCGDTIGTNTLFLFSIDLKICLIFLTNVNKVDTSIVKDNLLLNL